MTIPPTKPTRKTEPRRVYQLRIRLLDLAPAIWRTILVPDTLTLAKLDRVVQAAMGWTNSHLHEWQIGGTRYGLTDLDWDSDDDLLDERKHRVGRVLGEHVTAFGYTYDFGDSWTHEITVEQRLDPDPMLNTWPMCIAGANACPPEDVGGPPGYLSFVAAIVDPLNAEHSSCWHWNGGPFDPRAFSLNDANRAIQRLR